jgi:hypothetical protein
MIMRRSESVPINYDALMSWKIPAVEQVLTKRDTMLYALGTGLGCDPLDENQLRFVYEKDLLALPTMAIVLATPGPWHRDPQTGVDGTKVARRARPTTACCRSRAARSDAPAHRHRQGRRPWRAHPDRTDVSLKTTGNWSAH